MFAASKTAAAAAGTPPASTDPQFPYVSLLLNDTGTNGQQNNTFLDSSTNNFTITRNGTPTQGSITPYWPDGQWSNYFSGTTQNLAGQANAAFNFGTGDFTVEMWVFIAGNSAADGGGFRRATVFAVASGTNSGFTFTIEGSSSTTGTGLSLFRNINTQTSQAVTGTINQSSWNHIAVCRSGTSLRFFLNGTQMGSTLTDSGSWGDSTYTPYIGGNPNNGSYTQFTNGYISNLRVVKGTAVYTSNFTPSTTPLTAVSGTSLLTCQSNRFKDNSSNNFAITVNGTPTVQSFDPFSPAASYSTATNGGSIFCDANTTSVQGTGNVQFSGDFTIEGWIYMTSATGRDCFKVGSEAPGRVSFGVDSSRRLFSNAYGSSSILYGGTSVPLNAWTHIAWVRSGTTVTGYVNGVAQGTQTISGNVGNTTGFLVAQGPGYFANARYVNGTAIYTSNFTPPTSPVTAVTGTSLLLNFTNAGIYDAATLNDLVTVGDAKVSTAVAKFGGSSMAFDGTGDYLSYVGGQNADMGTGSFTIEFWMYATAITSQMNILATGGSFGTGASRIGKDLNFGMGLYTRTTVDNLIVSEGSNTFINGAANQWVHYAFVRNGNSFTLYRNGTSVSTATYTGSISFNLNGSTVIGTDWANDYFTGYLDDLRITKGYARYTANFTPPTAPFPTR